MCSKKLDPFKVCVRCVTYNHTNYIKDTMNGFAIQRTNFPFVCTIIDDASTDGEPEVIQRYLEQNFDLENRSTVRNEETDDYMLSFAQHKTNKNCFFAVFFLKYNHYSIKKTKDLYIKEWHENTKYIALCEGDDYWTDPLKLQKQVDVMEAHPDIAMCCSDAKIQIPSGELDWSRSITDRMLTTEEVVIGGGLYIQTPTLLYRTDLRSNPKNPYPDYCSKCHVGDYPLTIWASLNGGIYYLAGKTAVYRFLSENSWVSRQRTTPIEKLILGWRSEVEMLQGLDQYSGYKYHRSFQSRAIHYMYENVMAHLTDYFLICRYFPEITSKFTYKQRWIVWRRKIKYTILLVFKEERIINKGYIQG